jgi:hypothetical protein
VRRQLALWQLALWQLVRRQLVLWQLVRPAGSVDAIPNAALLLHDKLLFDRLWRVDKLSTHLRDDDGLPTDLWTNMPTCVWVDLCTRPALLLPTAPSHFPTPPLLLS